MSGNKCQFKEDCAYSHSNIKHDEEKNILTGKVDILEKTVNELNSKLEIKDLERFEKVLHALTRKVLYLENEIKEIRNNSHSVKEVLHENCDTEENSFNHNDIKHSSSTPKVLKEKEINKVQNPSENFKETEEEQFKEVLQVKKMSTNKDTHEEEKKSAIVKENSDKNKKKAGKDPYQCEDCDYTCKKFTTLSKHKNSKHINHMCKVCGKNFNNSMNLLRHVAIEHNEEDVIINNIIHMDNEQVDTDVDRKKEAKGQEDSSIVWSESMLDEYL